jgi:hypothetical protein
VKAVKTRVSSIKKLDKRIEKLKEQLKELNAAKDKLTYEAIDLMDKEGLKSIKESEYTITVSELDVPTMKDFMRMWHWAKKNDVPEIFQRRISSKAWREHDQDVPGVGVFTKRSLSIRSR